MESCLAKSLVPPPESFLKSVESKTSEGWIKNFCILFSSFAGLQNSAEDSTLKWYKELQELAAQCAQSIDQLSSAKDVQVRCFFLSFQYN